MIQPTCAYRFQFTPDDTFAVATSIVPYLAWLGVSHLYLSPIAEAEKGSRHGYDIVDPGRVRAELGGEEGFNALIRTLERHGMGWILDIVPNHLSSATPEDNPWLWDVLEHGPDSSHADAFDIDWAAADGKILMPMLDRPVEQAIDDGDLTVMDRGVNDQVLELPSGLRLPLRPESDPQTKAISELVLSQHYRLIPWQSRQRNVRRFFEIDSLVAVAIEKPEVCEARHQLLRRLLQEYPSLAGVRVDHVDGLADPDAYLTWLRKLIGPDRLLLTEKIVLGSETVPSRWPVDGTTGYEFARLVDRLLLNQRGFDSVVGHYVALTGDERNYDEIEAQSVGEVLADRLAPDVGRIAGLVSANPLLGGDRGRAAIAQLAASFRRYRTYLPAGGDADREVLDDAACRACHSRSKDEVESIDAFVTVVKAPSSEAERKAATLFQQLTGPALAKGIEDRAIYRYLPLAALNEVGASPLGPSARAREFHDWATWAAVHAPRSMLTTSTHDNKRSGDVRARLLTLSDHPHEWRSFCDRWIDFNDRLPVDRIDRYVILQHATGAWPISSDRLVDYMRKALREGAQRSSWIDTDHEYESQVEALVRSLLADSDFRNSADVLVGSLGARSLGRSLIQTLLRLTAPGFGDLYRGDEVFDLSLVDPDNRRPVDWDGLAELATQVGSLDVSAAIGLSASLAKLAVITRTLGAMGSVAGTDEYRPLAVSGALPDLKIVAFARAEIVVVVNASVSCDDIAGVQLELPTGDWNDLLVDGRPAFSGDTPLAELIDPTLPLRLLGRV